MKDIPGLVNDRSVLRSRCAKTDSSRALTQFAPTDSLYSILHDFLLLAEKKESVAQAKRTPQQSASTPIGPSGLNGSTDTSTTMPAASSEPASVTVICLFCQTTCGRSIKDCARAHGGRPALTSLLRKIPDDGHEEPRAAALYELYQAVRFSLSCPPLPLLPG